MVKLDAEISEIEGKGPGGNWRVDQCGQHLQAPGRYVDKEPTEKQLKRQRAFSMLMNYIRRYATIHFVMCWSNWACLHSRLNKKGVTITLAWHTMFISYNINGVVAGNPIQELPPGYPSQ